MMWGCARRSSSCITGLRSLQLLGSFVLAKRKLKVMTSRRGARRVCAEGDGAGETDADESEIAALESGRVTAVAKVALRPRRRVTRRWFGTEAPSVAAAGRVVRGASRA